MFVIRVFGVFIFCMYDVSVFMLCKYASLCRVFMCAFIILCVYVCFSIFCVYVCLIRVSVCMDVGMLCMYVCRCCVCMKVWYVM